MIHSVLEDELMALKTELNKLRKSQKGTKGGGKTTNKSKKKRVDITRRPRDIHKPVKIEGKNWYWCSKETGGKCTGVLRRHKPSECKGISNSSNSSIGSKRSGSSMSSDSSKKLKLKAKETLVEGEAENSADELSAAMDEITVE